MKVYESPELNRAVRIKINAGMREHLKKVATEYVRTNEPDAVVRGMCLAAKYADGDDVLYSTIHKGVLVFSCKQRSEQEWISCVNELSKKELATPRSVLVKSMALRMEKFRREINRINKENAMHFIAWRVNPYPIATDLVSSQAVHDYVKLLEAHNATFKAKIKMKANELLEFLRRDDLDDTVIHDAWNLIVAKEVMES